MGTMLYKACKGYFTKKAWPIVFVNCLLNFVKRKKKYTFEGRMLYTRDTYLYEF